MNFPDYAGLLARTDAPAGSSWGVFGADDEVGTLNFITPEITRQAAALVQRGRVFNLDHRLDAFQPPVTRHRHQPTHTIFSMNIFQRISAGFSAITAIPTGSNTPQLHELSWRHQPRSNTTLKVSGTLILRKYELSPSPHPTEDGTSPHPEES